MSPGTPRVSSYTNFFWKYYEYVTTCYTSTTHNRDNDNHHLDNNDYHQHHLYNHHEDDVHHNVTTTNNNDALGKALGWAVMARPRCFFFFFDTNSCIIVHTGLILRNTRRERAQTTRHVVWAICKFFFKISIRFFLDVN